MADENITEEFDAYDLLEWTQEEGGSDSVLDSHATAKSIEKAVKQAEERGRTTGIKDALDAVAEEDPVLAERVRATFEEVD